MTTATTTVTPDNQPGQNDQPDANGFVANPIGEKAVKISGGIRIASGVLLLVLLGLEWVKGGGTGLEGSGGAGFGVLTLITAVVTIVAAAQMMRGKRRETKLLGLSQLSFMLSLALFFTNLVFLWVYRTGGAPKWVYVGSNVMIYASVVGVFAATEAKPAGLGPAAIRKLGFATIAAGLLITLAPLLEYSKLSSGDFTGYEPGGPRVGLLSLVIGGIAVMLGLVRAVDTTGATEGGRYTTWPHIIMGLGIAAIAPAFAWLVTGLWSSGFDPGVGVYASLAAGVGLFAVGVVEGRQRNVPGI